jgi:hypothetical protein
MKMWGNNCLVNESIGKLSDAEGDVSVQPLWKKCGKTYMEELKYSER